MFTHKVDCSKCRKAIVLQLSWPLNKDDQLSKICIAHSFEFLKHKQGSISDMVYECLLCDRILQRLTPLQHCQALGFIAKSNSFFLWRVELLELSLCRPALCIYTLHHHWTNGWVRDVGLEAAHRYNPNLSVSAEALQVEEQNRVLEVRQKRNQASWNLAGECVCGSVCTFVCVHAWTLLLLKKQIYGSLTCTSE